MGLTIEPPIADIIHSIDSFRCDSFGTDLKHLKASAVA